MHKIGGLKRGLWSLLELERGPGACRAGRAAPSPQVPTGRVWWLREMCLAGPV